MLAWPQAGVVFCPGYRLVREQAVGSVPVVAECDALIG